MVLSCKNISHYDYDYKLSGLFLFQVLIKDVDLSKGKGQNASIILLFCLGDHHMLYKQTLTDHPFESPILDSD